MSTRPPEDRLAELLRDRAARQPAHPISMTEVAGRARTIRRRRRTAVAALAAAVVAAIAVPTAVLLNGQDQSAPPTHQVTPTPTPTPSGSPSTRPSPTVRAGALAKLPAGPAPAAYTLGDQVHLGGARSALSSHYPRYAQVVAYHGGWLAFNEAEMKLVQTDAQGRLVAEHDTSESPFAVSQDGTQVAWFWADQADGSGHLTLGIPSGMSGAEQRQAIPAKVAVYPLAIDQGKVYYRASGDQSAVWVTDFVHPPKRVAGVGGVWDYDPVGQLALESQGSTDLTRVYDVAHRQTRKTYAPGWEPRSFSPDGKLVLGRIVDTGGNEVGYWITDTYGVVRGRFDLSARGIQTYQAVWENDGSVLVDASDRGGEALLRLRADGKVERATPVVKESASGYGVALP